MLIRIAEKDCEATVDQFKSKYEKAKVLWSCSLCQVYDLLLSLDGMIKCFGCYSSHHKKCALEKGEPEKDWMCKSCRENGMIVIEFD